MFRDVYWLRDLTSKAVRRVKKLAGRPDPSPWVLRPQRRKALAPAYADLVVGLDFIGNTAPLARMFHEALSPLGLSLLIANKHNVAKLTHEFRAGGLRPVVYLDLCSAVEPAFGELLAAAAGAGVHTVGKPEDLERWTWKARAQEGLERAGLPVPPTVVIRAGEPSRELTPEERARIGDKCVIKPSWGVAGKGVMANVRPTAETLAAARTFDPKDDYLVQRMIRWEKLPGGRTGYLRAYNILGARTLLWWAPETQAYDTLTWDDVRKHDLLPVFDLVERMTRLTGMEFFSSEVAITAGSGADRFVLIDYCNDQCDLNPASAFPIGPPDAWVKWVCERFAEYTWRRKHGMEAPAGHTIWLPSPTPPASMPARPRGADASRMVTAA